MSRLDAYSNNIQSYHSYQSPKICTTENNSPRVGLTSAESSQPGIFPSPKSTVSLESMNDVKDIDDVYAEPNLDFFKNLHIGELAKYVSQVLTDIVAVNDKSPFTTAKLTRFHSRAPPSISIQDYILRIVKFCNLEKAVLIVLLYLVDLFTDSYSRFVLSSLTVHRFIITAVAVASKGLCDIFCTNRHYAKVGGVSVIELNLLEVEFLTRVSYKIVPPMGSLPKYYHLIEEKGLRARNTEDAELREGQNQGQNQGQGKGQGHEDTRVPNRKHSRDDSVKYSNISFAPSNSSQTPTPSTHTSTNSSSAGAAPNIGTTSSTNTSNNNGVNSTGSGSRGLKAVKDTFKFLHNKRKKRE